MLTDTCDDIARKGKGMAMMSRDNNVAHRGFTLIEILIVVVILGILSAIIIPQFTDASEDANDATVRNQLQTLRGAIELYRLEQLGDPDLIARQWTDMISFDYLTAEPKNPLNSQTAVAAAPGAGIGWIWRDKGNGSLMIYATDVDSTVEFTE